MIFPSIDSISNEIKNKFILTNAIGLRAKEISEGSLPYIDNGEVINPIETAMKEFAAKKLKVKISEAPTEKAIKKAEIKAKAKEFWTLDDLEKKDTKKAKKSKKEKKKK